MKMKKTTVNTKSVMPTKIERVGRRRRSRLESSGCAAPGVAYVGSIAESMPFTPAVTAPSVSPAFIFGTMALAMIWLAFASVSVLSKP